jgi:flagellin-specific chaperone FliS
MKIQINKREANVIQVALDHLYEEQVDILSDAVRLKDYHMTRQCAHIIRAIEDVQAEIKYNLEKPQK